MDCFLLKGAIVASVFLIVVSSSGPNNDLTQSNCSCSDIAITLFSKEEFRKLSVSSSSLYVNEAFFASSQGCRDFQNFLMMCVPVRYFWNIEVIDKGSGSSYKPNVKIQLNDDANDVSNLRQTSLSLAARRQAPVIFTTVGNELNVDLLEFNKSCHCWKMRIDPTVLESNSYLLIKQKKEIISFGSFISDSIVPISTARNYVNDLDDLQLKPADHIKRKIFSSICSPYNTVLSTETNLLLTNDAFKTYQKMKVALISHDFLREEQIVADVSLSGQHIFILINKRVYASDYKDSKIQFKKVVLISTETEKENDIIGISTSPICYRGITSLPENARAYAWSNDSIYVINRNSSGYLNGEQFNLQHTFNHDISNSLIRVYQAVNPEIIYILMRITSDSLQIYKCHVMKHVIDDCIHIVVPSIQLTSEDHFQVEVLSSADVALLITKGRNIIQISRNNEFVNVFSSGINGIYSNQEKNGWLVCTQEDKVYFGKLHIPSVSELRSPSANQNYVFHFLSQTDVRYIEWFSTNDEIIITSKVYNIMSEVEHSIEEVDKLNQIVFVPSLPLRNVMRLESVHDSFILTITILTTWNDEYQFDIYHDFQNLTLKYETEVTLTTKQATSDVVFRSKQITIRVITNCTQNPQECETGFALVELVYLPTPNDKTNLPSLYYGYSKVFMINMTCPASLNMKITYTGFPFNCTNQNEICYIQIDEADFIYLEFGLHEYDEFLSTITDDVLLVELNGRTGFELHNFNLLKKICYQCSQFGEVNSSSHLMLQTMKSACPCNVNSENENKWAGNISFANAYSSSTERNTFLFSAKVLSKSFCDLKMEFIVELVKKPTLLFLPWEYIFMLVFVVVTAFSLCISYHNYIKHMKLNREKGQLSG